MLLRVFLFLHCKGQLTTRFYLDQRMMKNKIWHCLYGWLRMKIFKFQVLNYTSYELIYVHCPNTPSSTFLQSNLSIIDLCKQIYYRFHRYVCALLAIEIIYHVMCSVISA